MNSLTPKERAVALVDNFHDNVVTHHTNMSRVAAISCALICVREILGELNRISNKDLSDLQFWSEVEYEIKLLSNKL